MRRHAIVISILLICHVCTTQEIAPQYVTIDDSENWEPYDGRDFHPILASHHDVEQPSEDTVGIDKQTNDLMPAGQSSSPIPQSQYDSPEPLPSEDTVVVDKQTNDGIPAGQSSSPIPQSPDDSPEPMPSEDTVGIDKQTNDGIPAGQSIDLIPQSPDDSPEPLPSEDTVGIDKQTNDGIPAGQSSSPIPQSPDDSPEPLPSEDTVAVDKQTNDGIPAGQSSDPIPQSQDVSPKPSPTEETVLRGRPIYPPEGRPIPRSQDNSPKPSPPEDTVVGDKQVDDVKEDDEAMKNLETIKFESNSEPSDPYEFETDQESYFQVLLTPYIMYSLLTLACIVAAVTYQFFLKNDSTPIKQSIGAVNEASNHTGPPLRVIQSSKERDIARLERTNKLLGMKRRLAPLETRIKEFQLDDPCSRLTESKLRIKTMKPYEILLEEKQELSTKVKMNRYERLLQIRNLKDIKKIPGILRYIDYQKQRESRELNICTMLAEDEFLREQMELFRELRANFQQEYSNLKSEIDNVRVRGRDIERERLNFLSGEIETRN